MKSRIWVMFDGTTILSGNSEQSFKDLIDRWKKEIGKFTETPTTPTKLAGIFTDAGLVATIKTMRNDATIEGNGQPSHDAT
jgi:hypothetical protein